MYFVLSITFLLKSNVPHVDSYQQSFGNSKQYDGALHEFSKGAQTLTAESQSQRRIPATPQTDIEATEEVASVPEDPTSDGSKKKEAKAKKGSDAIKIIAKQDKQPSKREGRLRGRREYLLAPFTGVDIHMVPSLPCSSRSGD